MEEMACRCVDIFIAFDFFISLSYWMPLLYDCLFLFWWFVYIIAPDNWNTWPFYYPAPTWLASYRVDEIWLMFNLTIPIGQSDQPRDARHNILRRFLFIFFYCLLTNSPAAFW
jgi:hypothetical protein